LGAEAEGRGANALGLPTALKGATPFVVNGDFDPASGELSSFDKGRGVGDCGYLRTWVWTGRGIGTHRAAALPLVLPVLMKPVVGVLLRPGDGWWFVGTMAIAGAASAGYLTLPLGMMGDVIDYDTFKTGTTRGGLYFGIWSFAQKLSPAIAVGITLPLLTLLGFDPAAKGSTTGVEALKYVFALGSAPLFLVGAFLLMVFPIDARRHGIIRRRLDALADRKGLTG